MRTIRNNNKDSRLYTQISLLLTILLLSCTAFSKELLRTTTTWEGGDIIYPQGNAEVTSIKLHIPENEVTPFHCHPVPTLGYILKGQVEVETQSGKTVILREGDSAVEVLKTIHRGKAVDGAVDIVVFYAGATDIPNTVLASDKKAQTWCI